jgi:fibro-slime domain-containing protein
MPNAAPLLASVLAVCLGCAGVHSSGQPSGSGGASGNVTGGGGGGGSGSGGTSSSGTGRGGSGVSTGSGGSEGVCDHELRAVVRDFKGFVTTAGEVKHPDFEYVVADDKGIVQPMLGADSKPVYAGGPTGTVSTTGKDAFDQWYRDVDGVNLRFDVSIPLAQDPARPGVFVYDSDMFFPLANDQGFGNQYQSHNFDFTTEIHFNFPYRGGEVFNFRGDDDLFLFVNGQLVVNLGGVHVAEMGKVDLDMMAGTLGLQQGMTYRMDIFHAERHVDKSTFHIETTLQCIDNVIVE